MTNHAESRLPLDGIRVLDFTRFVAGPYATMLLADAGADVVKVEPPGGDETRSLDPMFETPTGKTSGYFHRFNRSKRSMVVDFASDEGRDLILRLLPSFDVVVENFRPGVLASYGLGYEELSARVPRVVYCSISGYGHTPSPHRDDPAFAILAEVSAGVVGRSPRPDDPPIRLSAPLGDLFPASHAVSGICMALLRRERTGIGAHVDIAMHDALVSLNENAIGMSATTGNEVLPTGRLTYAAPFGIFRAPDGYICIAVLGERVWQRFCRAIDRPELADDDSLASGTARSAAMGGELGHLVEEWVMSMPREEAVRRLVSSGVPAGIVATPFDVINSEQARARDLLWDVPSYTGGTFRAAASPIRLEPGGFAAPGVVPQAGRDTASVLQDLGGLGRGEIEDLVRRGVVGTGE